MKQHEHNEIKLGVIGTGRMGQYHVNVIKQIANATLVGIYDKSKKQRDEVAKKYETKAYANANALIDECDGVIVAVPTKYHFEYAHYALTNKTHVLVEKPMTVTVAEARKIASIAKKNKLTLQVGHVERFNGAVQELKNVMHKPNLIEVRRLAPYNARINDVGVVLDLMIHDLDIVLNLVTSPLENIHAAGGSVFSKYEDVASATLQFKNGTIAVINASRATQEKIRTLEISQPDAYIFLNYTTQDIEIHRQSSSASVVNKSQGINYRQESSIERVFIHRDNPLKLEIEHFIGCITKEVSPFVTIESEVETLAITQQILKKIHGTKKSRKK